MADAGEKTPRRRKACNECKQQKLRCDPTSESTCTRCNRLGLECRFEDGFRRERKRRRSFDLENEIRDLREQLGQHRAESIAMPAPSVTESLMGQNQIVPNNIGPMPMGPIYDTAPRRISGPVASPSVTAGPTSINTDGSSVADTNVSENSRAPGLTTRPEVDRPASQSNVSHFLPRPRALGNIALSVEEIDELFLIYLTCYHPFLPLMDAGRSPHEYYQLSELLFWTIISVASRRMRSQPTLLPRLARSVTELMWKSIRSLPHSLMTVQSLALLCTWPFPTSSSSTDPTFMLVGTLLQIGTHMGLHCAQDVQDFSKVLTTLNSSEHAEWVRTWEACNIVAQSVSIGCGLPIVMQTHEWPSRPRLSLDQPEQFTVGVPFWYHIQVERFRHQVSCTLASRTPATGSETSDQSRLALYRLLSSDLDRLEHLEGHTSTLATWYCIAARLHLQAFFLYDDVTMEGYSGRINTLYMTAYTLIELSLKFDTEEPGLFEFYPFFCHQVFVCAAFVILKILMNGYFRTVFDLTSGTKVLESAITALRKSSVVNNDLPARLGDVIAFFCAMPEPTVIGGVSIEDLRLRQVKNRLSMGVVYDCLWTWRKQFQPSGSRSRTNVDSYEAEAQMAFNNEDLQSILGPGFWGTDGDLWDTSWSL